MEVKNTKLTVSRKISITEWILFLAVGFAFGHALLGGLYMYAAMFFTMGAALALYKIENIAAAEMLMLLADVFKLSTDSQMVILEKLVDEASPPSEAEKDVIKKMVSKWRKGREVNTTERQDSSAV